MKKILILLMTSLLLAACAPAAAVSLPPDAGAAAANEPAQLNASVPLPSPAINSPETDSGPLWREIDVTQPIRLDLDGDGTDETLTVLVDDNAYTTTVTVLDDGAVLTDTLDNALYFATGHLADTLEDDGQLELYLSGDMASDDYVTCVYRLQNGRLERADFYGRAEAVNGRGLTAVEVVVDVFGTYGGTCFYRLEDRFAFSPASSSAIHRYAGDWDERKLTLRRDGLPAEILVDGRLAPTTLLAGTELMLIESDEASYAVLEAADGTLYRVALGRPEGEWAWFIGGVSETEWFGELLYAG